LIFRPTVTVRYYTVCAIEGAAVFWDDLACGLYTNCIVHAMSQFCRRSSEAYVADSSQQLCTEKEV
jgi:hypothetical protein